MAMPRESDLQRDEIVTQWTAKEKGIVSDSELQLRNDALQFCEALVRKWVKLADPSLEPEPEAKLLAYGSFRLGAHTPASDIDMCLLTTDWCERDDVFGRSPSSLQQVLASSNDISDLEAIPGTRMRFFQFKLWGIRVDLTCAHLRLPQFPVNLDLSDDTILDGMDWASVISISGRRDADKLMELIPTQQHKAYISALRFLKLWGIRRGVYSKMMGFVSGTRLALMAGYICLCYPNACASIIIARFFSTFRHWPDRKPVKLTATKTGGALSHKVWAPKKKKKRDAGAILPILTPSYPSDNAGFNISVCSKSILDKELERGHWIILACDTKPLDLDKLAAPLPFLSAVAFTTYVKITVAASNQAELAAWSGYTGACIGHLATSIHKRAQLTARAWPHKFTVPGCAYRLVAFSVSGLLPPGYY